MNKNYEKRKSVHFFKTLYVLSSTFFGRDKSREIPICFSQIGLPGAATLLRKEATSGKVR